MIDRRELCKFMAYVCLVFSTLILLPDAWANRVGERPHVRTAPGYAFPSGNNSYHFLDNDRIVFLGASEDELERAEREHVYAVRVWNWRTGEIASIDRANTLQLCFDGETLEFVTHNGKQTVVTKRGSIGKLETIERSREEGYVEAMAARGELRHGFYCGTYTWSTFGDEGLCKFPLRHGDGYLDATGRRCRQEEKLKMDSLKHRPSEKPGEPRPATQYEMSLRDRSVEYFSQPGSEPTLLPILVREVALYGNGIFYAPHAQTYVLRAAEAKSKRWEGSWPRGLPTPIYLLKRGGQVTIVNVPYDDRLSGTPLRAVLSRTGLVLHSVHITRSGDATNSGAYLLKDGQLRQLFTTVARQLQVSPNGCHIAIDSEHSKMGPAKQTIRRMNVIDVC